MNKRWFVLLLVLLMANVCAVASADKYDILKPMWLNALENMQEQKAETVPLERREPKIVSGDDQLEVVRYAVYMDDEYSTEAYVYAQLRNTGESIIRLNGATLHVLDASGCRVASEEYASAKPDVVMPGGSLYVTEWLYDFVSDLDKVDAVEVEIERSEYSRKKIEQLDGVKAYVKGDYLYAELTNTTDEPLYDVAVTAVALDPQGRILDMLREETYADIGIVPGSTVIFRKYLEQHATEFPDAACEAEAWRYQE